jgi:predicted RNA binding protein YcfA (HicA-like mRNA interferase family)
MPYASGTKAFHLEHTQHTPLTNFPGSLPRPLPHELRSLASLQATLSSDSVRVTITELPGMLSSATRRLLKRPGFTPVARRTSHSALRSCFRPGTRLSLPHQPPSHCLASRKKPDTKPVASPASRQVLKLVDDTRPDILRIYSLLKEL